MLEDGASDKTMNDRKMKEVLTDRIADSFLDFLYNPSVEQKSYIDRFKNDNEVVYSNSEAPVYNKKYSKLFNIDSNYFTKFLVNKYSNIIPGYKLIDAEKFMKKVSEKKNHYKNTKGLNNDFGLCEGHVQEMNVKCIDVKSMIPDILEMKDNNIEEKRKQILKIKDRANKLGKNLEVMANMLDKMFTVMLISLNFIKAIKTI